MWLNLISILIEPLQSEFIRNAIGVSMMIGILCPVVGSYLIVQRMALMGDVMAHCVLPGLSIAAFFGVDRSIGAFVSSKEIFVRRLWRLFYFIYVYFIFFVFFIHIIQGTKCY